MLNKNLVILSYGKETEYRRAIFSILSFYSWSPTEFTKIRIQVYTDHPAFFEDHLAHLPIDYILLNDEMKAVLLGDSKYIHRIKVGVIAHTFNKYPHEHLLFIDSDTFFIKDPEMLLNGFESGNSFMHKREYNLEDGFRFFKAINQAEHASDFLDYIDNRPFQLQQETVYFGKQDYSWNSGVLGLHTSFSRVIPEVMMLTDEFYANSKWFISEQLAFALILQKITKIVSTDHLVVHYWGNRQKILLDQFIGNLFHHSKHRLIEKGFMKTLTRKMKRLVEHDLVLEQAVLALRQRHWVYGLKKSIQAILSKSMKRCAYIELFQALKIKNGNNFCLFLIVNCLNFNCDL